MLQLSKTLSPTGERKSKLESQKGDAEMIALILALHESSSLWIDTAIQRSGLSQAILHSLATFTELSQITEKFVTLFLSCYFLFVQDSVPSFRFPLKHVST